MAVPAEKTKIPEEHKNLRGEKYAGLARGQIPHRI